MTLLASACTPNAVPATRSSAEASTSTAPQDRESAPGGSDRGVVELAVKAAQLFCRPDLTQARWIADLDRVLTLEAASAYATVDPARVRCTRVVPPARVIEGDGFTQVVTVPTDAHPYQVTLSRTSRSDPWLVFRMTPASTT